MPSIEQGLYELGEFDALAARDTPVHRLDPRAKVLATFVFLVCVVSFPRLEVAALLPFLVFPVALAAAGDLPARAVLTRLAAAAPFALLVGALNPVLDRAVIGSLGPFVVTAGFASYVSIVLRFLLTASAALVLVGTTGMRDVTHALERLGVPDVLATQTLFLYRYIFVLAEEAMRMARARTLRSTGRRGTGIAAFGGLAGTLLLRTMARAERVHAAMRCRGFDGVVRRREALRFRARDALFLGGWSAALVAMRLVDVPTLLGRLLTGGS